MSHERIIRLFWEIKRLIKGNSFVIIIEVVPRYQQGGILFRFFMYIEERIKKIKYQQDGSLKEFCKEFKKIYSRKLDKNLVEYTFIG